MCNEHRIYGIVHGHFFFLGGGGGWGAIPSYVLRLPGRSSNQIELNNGFYHLTPQETWETIEYVLNQNIRLIVIGIVPYHS